MDTLILNVRYCDNKAQPLKQALDEKLAQELDYLQSEARQVKTPVATDWALQDMLSVVEPYGAGKLCWWLLTSRLLNNDIIAQVPFSSEYLWSQAWCGDALYKVHDFLMAIFGNTFTYSYQRCISARIWLAMTSRSTTMKRSLGRGYPRMKHSTELLVSTWIVTPFQTGS